MATRLSIVKPVPYESFEYTVNHQLELIEVYADVLSVTIHFENQWEYTKMKEKPAAYIVYKFREEENNETDKDDLCGLA